MKIQKKLFSEQTGSILKLSVSFVSLTMLTLHQKSHFEPLLLAVFFSTETHF